jgi:four helix bundle protein
MAYHSFENLDVWKRSTRLAVDVYRALQGCRDLALKDQMTRAAVSIASNIAEGAERDSRPELIRFLNIAKGSAAELRTQTYIAIEVGVINGEAGFPCPGTQTDLSHAARARTVAASHRKLKTENREPRTELICAPTTPANAS